MEIMQRTQNLPSFKEQAKLFQKTYLIRYPELPEEKDCYWDILYRRFELNSDKNAEFFAHLARNIKVLLESFFLSPNMIKQISSLCFVFSLWDEYSPQNPKYTVPIFAYSDPDEDSLKYIRVAHKDFGGLYRYHRLDDPEYSEYFPDFVNIFSRRAKIWKINADVWELLHKKKAYKRPNAFYR